MTNAQRVRVRQWELVRELGAKHYGLTVRQLLERTGTSKQTLYRDLEALRDGGVPIVSSTSSGEARYRLLRDAELPALGLNTLQIAALHLARTELEPLAGTAFVSELDALLAKLRPVEPQRQFQCAARGSGYPRVLKLIEQAIQIKRRLRIAYRAASRRGATNVVHVEPRFIRVAEGDPYLRAYCIERRAERTYKLARISDIKLTDDAATHAGEPNSNGRFLGAVKAWSGDPTLVKVAVDREVAWLASEYPLAAGQNIEASKDGGVVLEACVAGIVETAKWVLSWGGAAEALEPPELRSMVRDELARALSKYEGPGPTKVRARKEPGTVTGRLTRGGTAGA